MNDIRLKPEAQKDMEERFKLQIRAIELLAIIVSEFKSDPTSVTIL